MITSEELEARLWDGANKLRGSMDASRYKDYMLGLLFYKFISEATLEGYKTATRRDGKTEEIIDAYMNDFKTRRDKIVRLLMISPGYYVEPQYLYDTWLKEIYEGRFELSHITDGIAAFEQMIAGNKNKDDFQGLFSTMNLDDPALGSDLNMRSRNISSLIQLFADISVMDLQKNDIIGDSYEYLIGQFAMESGKKAGEFYTPHQVSDVIARIVALTNQELGSIYDPACGSGSLLLTIKHYLADKQQKSLHYYGQEKNTATYNLARMNMLLHGISPENMDFRNADTLADDWPEDPSHPGEGRLFDAVVMNPPYSLKDWNQSNITVSDPRFAFAGVLPPANKGDYAFLLHGLYHLGQDGIMAIVLPHGVLFRGDAEGSIRRKLIERNHIDAVIGLPSNLFTNTGIPVIIMVLKKNRPLGTPVLIIDASKGFVKEGKTNHLRERDIARIVDTYLARKEVKGFSALVGLDTIKDNGYNLNIPRYVDSIETEIPQDVDAHLFGGIPKKNIDDLTVLQDTVPEILKPAFSELRPGYLQMIESIDDLRNKIEKSAYLENEKAQVTKELDVYLKKYWEEFKKLHEMIPHPNLAALQSTMLQEIKDILSRHNHLDVYSGYQLIADIWDSELTHDLKIIREFGFYEAARMVETVTVRNGKKEVSEQRGRLISNQVMAQVLFSKELDEIDSLNEEVQDLESQKQEKIELATSEDDENAEAAILATVLNEAGTNFDTKELNKREKAAEQESFEKEILKNIKQILACIKKKNGEIKDKTAALKKNVIEKYPHLTEFEIDQLYKFSWFNLLDERITKLASEPLEKELDIIDELNQRYADTLDDIDKQIEAADDEFMSLEKELVVME